MGVRGRMWLAAYFLDRAGRIAAVLLFALLMARAGSAAPANVTWNPNPEPDVTGYIVFWGTTSGSYTNSFDVGNTTSYAFTPLNTSLTYYIVVQAYDSAGLSSPFSQEVVLAATTTASQLPTAVTGAASGVTTTAASLNGTANPNGSSATAYFQYGTTTGYGGLTQTASLGAGTAPIVVSGGNITGLTCATLYHYRVLASNTTGTAAGADATFTTAACTNTNTSKAPIVTTGTASSVNATSESVNGSVNSNGWQTTASFQYGLSTAYGNQTPAIALGDGMTSAPIASGLSGLACNTVYHFRAVATNAQGTTNGADATFTTGPCASAPPIVTTGAAGGISITGATLNGAANPNGAATTAVFQYGLTVNYGVTTPAVNIGAGSTAVAMTAAIAGLTCNTAYHFRAVATNSGGTRNGADATFTTAACPAKAPVVATGVATGINVGGATLNGSVNPNGAAATAFFQYGLTPAYGSTTPAINAGAGTVSTALAAVTSGLACNTVYHFRAAATNSGGTTTGADSSFTTAPCVARLPVATTGAASSISTTIAILNGTANPNGTSTVAYFRFGPTASYGNTTPAVLVGAGTVNSMIGNGGLSGLNCGTVYHFQAVATNSAGTVSGADASFTTAPCPPKPPSVATGSATAIGPAAATLTGTASSNGAATSGYFQFGKTTAYGGTTPVVTLGLGTGIAIGGGSLAALSCNTVYHFRAVAANVAGTTYGADAAFTTGPCPLLAPSVLTGSALAVNESGAALTGIANPNGSPTTAFFQYGRTTAYSVQTSPVNLGLGNLNVAIGGGTVSGLTCNTVFHYRAVASNAGGTTYGNDGTFKTSACITGQATRQGAGQSTKIK